MSMQRTQPSSRVQRPLRILLLASLLGIGWCAFNVRAAQACEQTCAGWLCRDQVCEDTPSGDRILGSPGAVFGAGWSVPRRVPQAGIELGYTSRAFTVPAPSDSPASSTLQRRAPSDTEPRMRLRGDVIDARALLGREHWYTGFAIGLGSAEAPGAPEMASRGNIVGLAGWHVGLRTTVDRFFLAADVTAGGMVTHEGVQGTIEVSGRVGYFFNPNMSIGVHAGQSIIDREANSFGLFWQLTTRTFYGR